jgi:VanZ family protein
MRTNYRLWQSLLVVYWLALLTATHVPSDFPGVPTNQWDKVVHFAAYAVLAILFATTWQLAAGLLTMRHLRAAWLLLCVAGALDEGTQFLVGRDSNILDWLADAAGVAAGLAMFVWLRRRSAAADDEELSG